ncbi:hypothetical protein [Halapricum desulfuricans]|uniref:E3 Ubiquitin ligase family protein n=1 Tax=Halapricum desulfuricans TaxID=2841257 RepID=A0A897N771_9EURY|nr:hypothetical protein [Halapricum desulfuricans]QSG08404.1 E3 Ubiquitin ligase family protein [Halapricum desulfuricans]
MPPTFVLVVIAGLVAIALVYGYRALVALLVLRSVPSEPSSPSRLGVDGEQVALTGELVVDEPVETGDAAVPDADRPVGAYVWRARFPDNTNSDLTIEDWGWERQHWHTFASGIESGRVSVRANGRTVAIDLSWFEKVTGVDTLGDLELGGVTNTERLSTYLWDSRYHYLRNRTEHRSFRWFAGHVRRHNEGVDLDRYLLEARPLLEGTTVSVSGELRIEAGQPILRGSDETPLLVSDQGFDGHRCWLRQRLLREGGLSAGLLVAAVALWLGVYLPLAVLVVGWLVYVGYNFVQDIEIFVDFLQRLRK